MAVACVPAVLPGLWRFLLVSATELARRRRSVWRRILTQQSTNFLGALSTLHWHLQPASYVEPCGTMWNLWQRCSQGRACDVKCGGDTRQLVKTIKPWNLQPWNPKTLRPSNPQTRKFFKTTTFKKFKPRKNSKTEIPEPLNSEKCGFRYLLGVWKNATPTVKT